MTVNETSLTWKSHRQADCGDRLLCNAHALGDLPHTIRQTAGVADYSPSFHQKRSWGATSSPNFVALQRPLAS